MSGERYACVHAANFPLQSLLRLSRELMAQPIAVLEGSAPLEYVCAVNARARKCGAAAGMTKLEAEAVPGLQLLKRSLATQAAARAVVLECAAAFSPRIEEMSRDTACIFILDIAGTERLFGASEMLAKHLRASLLAAGFHTSIAVSANYHCARLAAIAMAGITVIAKGVEGRALSQLPVSALNLSSGHEATFSDWGIRTLGELAALPELELISRFGQQAAGWRCLALGIHPHAFEPLESEIPLREFCEFETPVEQIDSLLFVASRMIDSLIGRAVSRSLALATLTIQMKLEKEARYQRVIHPALPSQDRKVLLKLLQLEIAAHPPPLAVLSLALIAEARIGSKMQLGLFAPQTPEPSRLDVTLARLKAIVGDERVGSPVLRDAHSPDSFRMENFSVDIHSPGPVALHPYTAVRRLRPPVPLRVTFRELRLAAFQDRVHSYTVHEAFGPWKANGCWWSAENWSTEEWDVLAARNDGVFVLVRLAHECRCGEWRLEALYD